jgi:hypothetical protein
VELKFLIVLCVLRELDIDAINQTVLLLGLVMAMMMMRRREWERRRRMLGIAFQLNDVATFMLKCRNLSLRTEFRTAGINGDIHLDKVNRGILRFGNTNMSSAIKVAVQEELGLFVVVSLESKYCRFSFEFMKLTGWLPVMLFLF